MSRVPAGLLSLMLFGALSYCASPAAADPIRLTSGIVDAGGPLDGPWNAEGLHVAGTGFRIDNSLEDENAFVQLRTRPTLAPGALVDFSGVLHVEDPIGVHLNDSFGIVTAPFTMSFDASPMQLTCSAAGAFTRCTGSSPFTFDAELTITPFGGVPEMHRLVGRGTAEGSLVSVNAFEGGSVNYIFASSAVPEPATLSLITTGAIVAAAGAWRRRRDRGRIA